MHPPPSGLIGHLTGKDHGVARAEAHRLARKARQAAESKIGAGHEARVWLRHVNELRTAVASADTVLAESKLGKAARAKALLAKQSAERELAELLGQDA